MTLLFTILTLLLPFAQSRPNFDRVEPRSPDEVDFAGRPGPRTGTEGSARPIGFRMDRPQLSGRGCPPGSVTTQVSPDGTSVTILFDRFSVEATGTPLRRESMSCDVAVPIQVPAGFQLMVGRIDYRGFALAPNEGFSVLKTVTQLTTNEGRSLTMPLRRRQIFPGPYNQNFIASSLIEGSPSWSRCGESLNLRLATQIVAVTNNAGEQTMTTLDSIDHQAQAQYFIKWQQCGRQPPPPPRRPPDGPRFPPPHSGDRGGDHGGDRGGRPFFPGR